MCYLKSVGIDNEVYALLMNDGTTALWHAVMENTGSVVRFLLDMGTDVCIENRVYVYKY